MTKNKFFVIFLGIIDRINYVVAVQLFETLSPLMLKLYKQNVVFK